MVTLLDLLLSRARNTPDGVYFSFDGAPHTYAAVADGAFRVRDRLALLGVSPGASVLLFLGNSPMFFHAFFGALLHGAVPVPLSPRTGAGRARAVAIDCVAAAALGDCDAGDALGAVGALGIPALTGPDAKGKTLRYDTPRPGPAAFIQYTSGSTGTPKGALVSQRAMLANVAAFAQRVEAGERDVFSSMMPLFDPMGLVCFGLAPLYVGAPLVLFPEDALSMYPWLEGFGAHRVTVSGGSNTLLRLAVRMVASPAGYDLSSVRVLACGSEPIFPATLHRFEQAFAIPGRVKPAYGMAEATLFVTLTGAREECVVHASRSVSCGRPIDGVSVAIDVNGSATRTPFEPGEILVSSPSLMDRYVGATAAPPRFFEQSLLRTGDVGFLDDEGRLHVLGRKESLFVRGTVSIAPVDVEALSSERPEVRLAAAVGMPSGAAAGHRLALVLEVGGELLDNREKQRAIARMICSEAHRRLGYQPDLVAFTARGRIPLALNGKVQHAALRHELSAGAFNATSVVGVATLA